MSAYTNVYFYSCYFVCLLSALLPAFFKIFIILKVEVLHQSRLLVVPLPLSPSRETVNKPRGKFGRVKSWGRHALLAPQEFARPFFLAVFSRVTQDGLSERT